MISAARTTDRTRGGFSLMEIVMVLAIAAMVMGGAVGLMIYHSSESELRRVSSDIEVFAKQARTISMLQQKPYAVQFVTGKVLLLPLAEITGIPETTAPSRSPDDSAGSDDESASRTNAPIHKEITLKEGMVLSVRRWASEEFVEPEEKHSQVWRFDPNGLCEPLTLRLAYDGSTMENDFHPLTASIRESSMDIK